MMVCDSNGEWQFGGAGSVTGTVTPPSNLVGPYFIGGRSVSQKDKKNLVRSIGSMLQKGVKDVLAQIEAKIQKSNPNCKNPTIIYLFDIETEESSEESSMSSRKISPSEEACSVEILQEAVCITTSG